MIDFVRHHPYWCSLAVLIFAAYRYTASQACKLNFKYKAGAFNDSFLKQSKIKDLTYKPYWYCLNSHFQGFLYLIYETIQCSYYPIQYDRELFTLSDGGTLAIE